MSTDGLRMALMILVTAVLSSRPVVAAPDRPPDDAFQLAVDLNDEEFVLLIWKVAPEHRVYPRAVYVTHEGSSLRLAMPSLSRGDDEVGPDVEFFTAPAVPVLINDDLPRSGALVADCRGCGGDSGCWEVSKAVDLSDIRISASGDHG